MKKALIICLVFTLMIGCSKSSSNIKYEDVSNFEVIEHKFGPTDSSVGYIIATDKEYALIIGMNINKEYKQLQATNVRFSLQDKLNSEVKIGTKVRYISDGPTLTSYPGRGGIKVVDILDSQFKDTKTSEAMAIRTAINKLKELEENYSLYCINNVEYVNNEWKLNIVTDNVSIDSFEYYKVIVDDETSKVIDIIVYNQ